MEQTMLEGFDEVKTEEKNKPIMIELPPQIDIKDVKQVSMFNQHYYEVELSTGEKKFLPSVTTILSAINKPGLVEWYKQVGMNADILRDNAADKGSRVHNAIDKAIKGATLILNPMRSPYFTERQIKSMKNVHVMNDDFEFAQVIRAGEFLKQLNIKNYVTEQTVFSMRHLYAGTADLLIDIGEECEVQVNRTNIKMPKNSRWIIDWKTGSQSDEHKVQISAYAAAIEEADFTKDVHGAIIFYTNAKTKSKISAQVVSRDEIKLELNRFLALLNVYNKFFAKEIEDIKIPNIYKYNLGEN